MRKLHSFLKGHMPLCESQARSRLHCISAIFLPLAISVLPLLQDRERKLKFANDSLRRIILDLMVWPLYHVGKLVKGARF
jgi:hypothetical protein